LQRFAKPSSPNRRSLASDAARQCCGVIFMSRRADEAIKKWLAYFSAYGIKSGGRL
jgi:hypothetical protein